MKNRITFTDGLVLTDADFIGGIEYKQDLSGNGDLVIGTVMQQSIKFVVRQDEQTASLLIGKRGLWEVQWINEDTWNAIGYFNIIEAKRKDRVSTTIIGYDDFINLEEYIDYELENGDFNLPTTLSNHLQDVINVCKNKSGGVIDNGYQLYFGGNEDFQVKDNYRGINITGKQVLSYIAQIAGGFMWLDNQGRLRLSPIGEKTHDIQINNTMYKSFTKALFVVQPINWLIVQMNDDDFGVQAKDDSRVRDNVYKITNNPLLYAESTEEIQGAVNNIYNSINNIVYCPGKVKLFKDYGVKCGDYLYIDGSKLLITGKKITHTGVELTSSGNQWREATGEEVNPSIIALRGKTNELFRDLEVTRSTLTDKYNNLESEFKQTADSIKMTVDQDGATASITIGENTFTVMSEDGIEEKIGTIKLDGYVTFEGLADGTTTIDGACIKTGKINADRLQLTGAISWSDLDVEVQEEIQDGSMPDYIKETYIDSTTIKSPTIEGNQINLYGGTFTVKDSTGKTQYGYIGKGTGYAGSNNYTQGVILGASAGYENLGSGNYYFIATDSGVRMQGGSNAVYVTETGVFKTINGTNSPIGTAVFG